MDKAEENELGKIAARYATREASVEPARYAWWKPGVYLPALEADRVMLQLLGGAGMTDFARLSLLEVGCGTGGNLLRFLRWGFEPANLAGNDLLPQRIAEARRRLPAAVRLHEGDASGMDCGQFDIVYQSTVFSSILDGALRARLADRMWRMARPGGGVLWYDFCYDNPSNPDVRGVGIGEVRRLFPGTKLVVRRITLTPPLGRRAAAVSTRLYALLNALPLLRTHAVCWIPKPLSQS